MIPSILTPHFQLTLTARGDATPDLVWERYARTDLWSSWSPQIRDVQYVAPRIAAGTDGHVVGPLGLRVHFVIETVDETARTWRWRVDVGPVRLQLLHTVAADTAQGAATITRLAMTGPAPVLLGYAPLARLALARLVRP